MKNKNTITLLILILVAIITTFVACDEVYSGPFSVMYVVDGAVEKSAKIDTIDGINDYYTPQKEGYVFDGWYLDKGFKNQLSTDSRLSANVALYAKFSKQSFTVEFVVDGQVIDTQSVLYGESAVPPTPPTKSNQEFERWDTDFSNVTTNLSVNGIYSDLAEFTAKFLLNGQTIYTHTFSGGEKTSTPASSAEKKLNIPEGFEFVGWATMLDKELPEFFPERNVDYKAVLAIKDMNAQIHSALGAEIEYFAGDLTFSANHTEYSGIDYKYTWYLDGVIVDGGKSVSFKTPDCGSHKLTMTITATSQLAETLSQTIFTNFVITTATVQSISATDATFEYDGKPHNISVETIAGDKVEYSTDKNVWQSSLGFVNAGEYDVYVRLTRKNHHVYVTEQPLKLTITKHVVKGTIAPATISYGDDLPTTYKVNYSGFIGDDNQSVFSGKILFTTTAKDSLVIGTYSVSGDTSGFESDNYTLSLDNGVLNITKRVLIVTADSKTISVGDQLPALTITYTGFAPGENVNNLDTVPTISCAYTQGGMAGKYSIIVSGGESSNYHFVYKEGTLTVSRT